MKRLLLIVLSMTLISSLAWAENKQKTTIRDQEIQEMDALEKAYSLKTLSQKEYFQKKLDIEAKYIGKEDTLLLPMIQQDYEWSGDKQKEQVKVLASMAVKGTYSVPTIEWTNFLADKVLDRALVYREWGELACGGVFDYSSCSAVMDASRALAENAASMKLIVGEYLVRARAYSKAKKIYREIVVTFTGPAYLSYVKKAEFKLEDLKDMKK